MPSKNQDLHGNVPDHSIAALLLIDVINDLDFKGNAGLLRAAPVLARAIARLKRRAKSAGIPVIYVNDNFGKWQSDLKTQIAHCLKDDVPGRNFVKRVLPDHDDYFVLKPKHSAFFSTTLDTLLRYLQTKTLILAGISADRCVLFTANDAYLRDYNLFVPSDCVASNTARDNRIALQLMKRLLHADIRPSSKLNFARLRQT
jgi:nicotinamidase-related amidase